MIKVLINGSSVLEEREIIKAVRRTLILTRIKNALVSVAFVSARSIKKWNRLYRKKDKATDVLSFGFIPASLDEKKWERTGELLISETEAKKNAKEKQIKLSAEIRLLLVHGTLHLSGYDHVKKREAEAMFALQKKILEDLEA